MNIPKYDIDTRQLQYPHPSLQLQPCQRVDYHSSSASSMPNNVHTHLSMAPRGPYVFGPPPLSSGYGIKQDFINQPKPPVSVHSIGPTTIQESRLLQNASCHQQNVHETNKENMNNSNVFSSGFSSEDKSFLNPDALEFAPTPTNKDSLSVGATEFTSNNSGQTQALSQQMKKIVPNLSKESSEIRVSLLEQKENVRPRAPNFTTTELKLKRQDVSSPVLKIDVSSVNSESQTILSGVDWDVKLCDKCNESLFGHGSEQMKTLTFLKLKDISMQHKLKYLTMKAAVFVRESPIILTQPQELKSKLLGRLNTMCKYFGVQSQSSSSWQDDIACSVAVNLLIEEPDLSSSQNNGRFLQQLKDELESHMEIAQDILKEHQEYPVSNVTESIPKTLTSHSSTPGLNYNTSSNKTEFSIVRPHRVSESSSLSSLSYHTQTLNNQSDLPTVINCTSQGSADVPNQMLGNTSNFNTLIPASLPMDPESSNTVIPPNFQMGSVSTTSTSVYNPSHQINPSLLHGINALHSNLSKSSTPNISTSGISLQLLNPNPNALIVNPSLPVVPLITNTISNPNPATVAVSKSSDSLTQSNMSEELLNLQKNYLETLNVLNFNHQPVASTSMSLIAGTELSSDQFVSQISRNVSDFKLESYSPTEVSPSASIDDDISLTLNYSGQDRVRHSSSSTNSSDFDQRNVKRKPQQQHRKDLTGASGLKKIAPLDFRKVKNNSEKPESDFSSNFDSRLSELFVSVCSEEANEAAIASRIMPFKSEITSCKKEMASSTELKPPRRLTPLQRKLLKKNEQCSDRIGSLSTVEKPSQLEPVFPKTVELEEWPFSFQPQSDSSNASHTNDTSKWYLKAENEDVLESLPNPIVTAPGPASVSSHIYHSQFTDITTTAPQSDRNNVSVSLKHQCNLNECEVLDMNFTKSIDQNADSVDVIKLKAIGRELTQDSPPQSDIFPSEDDKVHGLSLYDKPFPMSTVSEDGDADTRCQFSLRENKEISVISNQQPSINTLINEASPSIITLTASKLNQSDVIPEKNVCVNVSTTALEKNDIFECLKPNQDLCIGDDGNTTILPSDNSNEEVQAFPSSQPGPFYDMHDNLIHQSDITDSAEQTNSQFQLYSDIVKQKVPQKSYMVALKQSEQYSGDAINNGYNTTKEAPNNLHSSSSLRKSNPALYDKNPMTFGPVAKTQDIDSTKDMATTGSRTWSSLFDSDSSRKESHISSSTKIANEKAVKNSDGDAVEEYHENNDKEDDKDTDSISSLKKFGKYGLDDFDNTPPALKTAKAPGNTLNDAANLSKEDSPSKLEREWKVVTKKSKKAGENQDMDLLLRNFRTQDYYKDLCEAITENYPGITMQTSQDVLESVFVEMDGLVVSMNEWEVMEEVEEALAQMCPDKLGQARKQQEL